MKICVLGAGVVGVSTAYALGRLGHEVVVIDKAANVASGASQANGAQLSYSYVDPFAGPQALHKLPSYLLGRDPGVQLGLSLSPAYLKWGLRFIRNCAQGRTRQNLLKRWELAQTSQSALAVIESELPKGAIARTGRGKIILAKSEKALADMAKTVEDKKDIGLSLNVLNPSECLAREPRLSGWAGPFAGGLHNSDDTTLDPRTYCQALKSHAEEVFGVQFLWGETVIGMEQIDGQMSAVRTNKALHHCDTTVVCLGAAANAVLKPLGLSVPIYPMRGYSLTLPAKTPRLETSITDPDNKIVFASLGGQVRIAGFMDANQRLKNIPNRTEQLRATAQRLWPTLADYNAEPHCWTDFRPMTPSGVPIIGQTRIDGLYLNVGHGALGYTFAAGSAMKISRAIGGLNMTPKPITEGQFHDIRL